MTDGANQGPEPSEADRAVLTNRQGHPVYDNQNSRTVNSAKHATVATNQRGGQMSFGTDLGAGQNPHVNYEPSITGGLREGT